MPFWVIKKLVQAECDQLVKSQRFKRKLTTVGSCSVYGANNQKYKLVRHRGKRWSAHRLVYAARHGDPGDGVVRHTCDNPSCVAEKHLVIGTQSDNVKDAYQRGRAKSPQKKGVLASRAKLSESEIKAIRGLVKTKGWSVIASKKYGVTPQQIGRVHRGY